MKLYDTVLRYSDTTLCYYTVVSGYNYMLVTKSKIIFTLVVTT